MPCKLCPIRSVCKSPCADLEKELNKVTACREETPLPEYKLEFFSEKNGQHKDLISNSKSSLGAIGDVDLLRAIETLSPMEKQCVERLVLDECSQRAVADDLGVSRRAVRSYVRRGLSKMKQELETQMANPNQSAS